MRILIASTKELCYFSGSFFLDRIQEELEKMNIEVVRLDFDEAKADYSLLEEQYGKTYDAILDINSKLPYLIDDDGKRVLNKIDAPFVNYILDHPLYHHPGLTFPIKRYYALGIDKCHVDYMKKNYPHLKDVSLLPVAGTKAFDTLPFSDRKNEILFAGTYLKDESLDEKILALRNQINDATYQVALDLWDAWKDTAKPIEECLLTLLKSYSGAKTFEEVDAYIQDFYEMSGFAELLNHMFLVDQKKRNQKREHILNVLSEGDLPIAVMGEGWENSSLADNLQIHFLQPRSMAPSLQVMGQYRYVLDINPMFARGLHDRVTSAWANGAVCISDMAKDFDGDIKDGENILFYEERNLSSLIRRLNDLDEADAESMAAEGQVLYEEKYNWSAHATQLVEYIKTMK